MRTIQTADLVRYRTMSTADLGSTFFVDDLFRLGELSLTYVDLDRTVQSFAVPGKEPIPLPTFNELRANYFAERRGLGNLNTGGPGTVIVNGESFDLNRLDALYVGRGNEPVTFASIDPTEPAEFYLLSYPARATYPTRFIRNTGIERVRLGAPESANAREITKLIHLQGVRSCQPVMGFTQLAPGSVWNTMPPHTHMRRSEVYLYFDLAQRDRVIHLMGPADETRHIVVGNKQVVLSPGWSIHAGVGTANYSFAGAWVEKTGTIATWMRSRTQICTRLPHYHGSLA